MATPLALLILSVTGQKSGPVRFELANVPPGSSYHQPEGIIVSLPKGCKVKPIEAPTPKEREHPGFNPLVCVETSKKGVISWMLGQAKSRIEKQKLAESKVLTLTQAPDFPKKYSAGKWEGIVYENEPHDLSRNRKTEDSRSYGLFRDDLELHVFVRWPKGNKAAKKDSLACAEAFIKTVKPNSEAKPVSTYPGLDRTVNEPIPAGIAALSTGSTLAVTNEFGLVNVSASTTGSRTIRWNDMIESVKVSVPRRWSG